MTCMKGLLLTLLMITLFVGFSKAQRANDYSANWKKVEQFENKGLTKSALSEVLKIYDLATKDKNDVQQIKASIYQIKYRNMVDYESNEKNIFFSIN